METNKGLKIEECIEAGYHEAVKLDDTIWLALASLGTSMDLDWRNCNRCTSTLAREVVAV